jgi:hypothetical protein
LAILKMEGVVVLQQQLFYCYSNGHQKIVKLR